MTIEEAVKGMRAANARLERHLSGVPADGPTGPGAYNPPPPIASGYPLEPAMPRPMPSNIRHLSDHERALAALYKLKANAERQGHTASANVYADCIRRLGGITDPYDTTLVGLGERRR
jgi:hypothetical protein